ncbi:MAG: NUDIX domain-containing protein [Pirellulaceae bacterium]|nr:NUDIX domain-containing protein [Pirellulaceae bacterium]
MVYSAGTLLYRFRDGELQVLLVHPSGNYNRRAPWSIPKGIPDDGEALEAAARRETREETGVEAAELSEIGSIDYRRSRKRIFAFAGPAPPDAEPCCASWEVDGAEFVAVDEARQRIHPDQAPFLDRLEALLNTRSQVQEPMP